MLPDPNDPAPDPVNPNDPNDPNTAPNRQPDPRRNDQDDGGDADQRGREPASDR